jgi:glutathione synthase/RimK-type ligase-like ATP-grasp enzyme
VRKGDRRTVLVHTTSSDFHTAVVSHALQVRGNQVLRWMGEDYPEHASTSMLFDSHKNSVRLYSRDGLISSDDVDVVWYRRRRLVSAPAYLDQRDVEFATEELRASERGHAALFKHAYWINPQLSADACDVKVRQLQVAQSSGLHIPKTLISNDPDQIKEFIGEVSECIYKPLVGYVWNESEKIRKTYTAVVTREKLPSDALLRATPGIFQERVIKSYEIRMQFFGEFHAGVRIESGLLKGGDIDWRIGQNAIASCQPAVMPESIVISCRQLMRNLGLVSGGFDFIVDPDGNWIFMEVNEAGQFLFLEAWCQELPLVDAFCSFVETADANFRYEPSVQRLRYREVCESASKLGLIDPA